MIQGDFFIQKYAALRLLQKFLKISGFVCLRQYQQSKNDNAVRVTPWKMILLKNYFGEAYHG